MRKVAWPTQPEVMRYSIIVTVCVIVYMVFVGGIDYVFVPGRRMVLRMSDNEELDTAHGALLAADETEYRHHRVAGRHR